MANFIPPYSPNTIIPQPTPVVQNWNPVAPPANTQNYIPQATTAAQTRTLLNYVPANPGTPVRTP